MIDSKSKNCKSLFTMQTDAITITIVETNID